eukprot:GHVH01016196.1.p1 GENE.GHVH01016196.1~~GHVH01016196.1.p1  ORF type:complete len:1178 (+),score=136.82 GHVH01016196.1:97-3630(+)
MSCRPSTVDDGPDIGSKTLVSSSESTRLYGESGGVSVIHKPVFTENNYKGIVSRISSWREYSHGFVTNLKWLKKGLFNYELMRCHFAILFSFPKLILITLLAILLSVGGVGTWKRTYYRDMHKLYAVKDSPEILSYHTNAALWNDSTDEFFVLIEPVDEAVDLWSLEGLHFSGWLDAVVRHISIKSHELISIEQLNESERQKEARRLARAYLQQYIPKYSRDKNLCDCPSCANSTCISYDLGAVSLPKDIQSSANLTHVFPESFLRSSVVRFEDICVHNQIIAAGIYITDMDSSYACVAMTPFFLVPKLHDVLMPGGKLLREVKDTVTLTNFDNADLVLGNSSDKGSAQATAMGFFYKLKSPDTDLDNVKRMAMETVMEAVMEETVNHMDDTALGQYIVRSRSSRSLQDALDASTAFDGEMKIRLLAAIISVALVVVWGLGLNRNVKIAWRFFIVRSASDYDKSWEGDLIPDSVSYLFGLCFVSMTIIVSSGFGASGFLYLCGLPHVPASESIPFMVLGIGVDDFFVIWNSYLHTYHSMKVLTPQARVLKAYQNTVNSISLSTITTVISFLIGCVNPFWHIQIFSINVAVCILSLYIACWTMLPIVILHHAKRHSKEVDSLVEHQIMVNDKAGVDTKSAKFINLTFSDREVLGRSQLWWDGPVVKDPETNEIVNCKEKIDPSRYKKSKLCKSPHYLHQYSLFLLHPMVKTLIVGFFSLSTIGGLVAIATKLTFGLALKDATPFSSPLRKYLITQSKHFSLLGDEFDVSFLIPTLLIDRVPFETFKLLHEWSDSICDRDSPYNESLDDDDILEVGICHNPVLDAIRSLSDFDDPEGTLTADKFYTTFNRISEHPINPIYPLIYTKGMGMINLFNDEFDQDVAKQMTVFRLKLVVPVKSDTSKSWAWYLKIRSRAELLEQKLYDLATSVLKEGDLGLKPDVVISSQLLPMWSADSRINLITTFSLCSALICVTTCSYILLGRSIAQAVLIFYTMVLIDIHLITLMVLSGDSLNILTMITLLMAQGFSVDYLAHMSHAFSHSKLYNSHLRVQSAILSVGRSISQATATTFVALFCLILSDKYTLRVFCRMVISTIACAFTFSMVYFPVLISFVNPKNVNGEKRARKFSDDCVVGLPVTPRVLVPITSPNRVVMNKDPDNFRLAETTLFRTLTPDYAIRED